MKRIGLLWVVFSCTSVWAVKGVFVGGRIGHVGLIDELRVAHGNSVGFGVDLGFRTNNFLDLVVQLNRSVHDNGLKLTAAFLAADLNLIRWGLFDFYLSVGPGFYFFNVLSDTATKFGIHGGFGADVWLMRFVRVGTDFRWHGVLSESAADNFWTVMARVGYLFEV